MMEVTVVHGSALIRLHLEPCLDSILYEESWETRSYFPKEGEEVGEGAGNMSCRRQNSFGLENRWLEGKGRR
jgi:hypothetical protein